MKLFLLPISVVSLLVGSCFCQPAPNEVSLCLLQQSVRQGEHQRVRTSGVFSEGLDLGVLDDAACPEEETWVELELRTQKNKEKLQATLDRSRRASVVLEGDFYGPPFPDPKLPEKLRENYHPNWGHLNCCRTKLIVRVIRRVEEAPAESSNQSPSSE